MIFVAPIINIISYFNTTILNVGVIVYGYGTGYNVPKGFSILLKLKNKKC